MRNTEVRFCCSRLSFGAEVGTEIRSRFTVPYTPNHGSWLNQAEIEIGLFGRQRLGSRRIPDLPTLRRECRAWNRHVNRQRVTINWQFNRRAARLKSATKGTSLSGHKTGDQLT